MEEKPALLVFDGDCGFCTSTVNQLRKHLTHFPTAVPWQHLDLASYGLEQEQVELYVFLLDEESGRRWRGADVFAALLAGQPELSRRLAGQALLLPGVTSVTRVGYRWVSEHRHQLPGGTPACALPSPKGNHP